jgi:hypothetical protein
MALPARAVTHFQESQLGKPYDLGTHGTTAARLRSCDVAVENPSSRV